MTRRRCQLRRFPASRLRQSGSRGLHISLGALIVLAVLVAAGIYLPRRGRANEPAASPAPEPPPAAAPEPVVAPPAPTKPAEDPAKKRLLAELEHQLDQLSSRAAAVNSSLDRLQQQQAAAGYGLRGDMVAKQATCRRTCPGPRMRLHAEMPREPGDTLSRPPPTWRRWSTFSDANRASAAREMTGEG